MQASVSKPRMSGGEEQSQDDSEDEAGTTDEGYRWKYLSTVVTIVVTLGYVALTLTQALGIAGEVTGGTWATFSLAFLAVVAYSVGVDTLREAKKARAGG